LRSNLNPPNFNRYYPVTEFDPHKLYINFFVYTSGIPSRIGVAIIENLGDVYGGSSPILSGVGWHLVSLKLSEMNFRAGRRSNSIPNLDQLFGINLSWTKVGGHILANEHAFVAIDHVVFTYGNPLVIEP